VAKTGSEEGLRSSLTRRIGFRAEHRYHRDDWSPEENSRVFGSAADPEFHGHDYLCDVTVSGSVDEPSGMLIDLVALDEVLRREVRERFDGRRINLDVPEFRDGGLVPSCEVLARFIFEQIRAALGGRVIVESVVVRESDTLSAEVRRG
jgi:6-pyruvoyltetrahydropterin/6-carboxytetrahydropterin synthase